MLAPPTKHAQVVVRHQAGIGRSPFVSSSERRQVSKVVLKGAVYAESSEGEESTVGTAFTVAAVQAAYVLMAREATTDKVVQLIGEAGALGAELIVFPEVFVPGTPIWIDAVPIWDGDEAWFARLVDQAVVVPSPTTERIAAAAHDAGAYVVVGVDEREPHGTTIYNTLLYFGPDGRLLNRHRKLMPTGSERTVWGMGDGSMLDVVPTELGRLGGLICWENYMPLARFHLYAQGVEIWVAPTLARGDGWIATMRHIAREGRVWVIGVNPCVRVDQIPADFPGRDRVWRVLDEDEAEWVEPGNSVICNPNGEIVAGPLRYEESILTAEVDLSKVKVGRRLFDPVGHYNRPDVFQLSVDTRSQRAVTIVADERVDPDT
jgi:predicted amidohydrolase